MHIITSLLSNSPYLEMPQGLAGWVGWLFFACVLLYLIYHWRKWNNSWGSKQLLILVLLGLCVPLSSLFFGFQLPGNSGLPSPYLPREDILPLVLPLSAIPWMLAGGLLGISSAALLGLLSGIIQAGWGTHNPFTILEVTMMAVMFTAAIRQRYRTPIYRALRHPLVAALGLSLFFPLLSLATTPLVARGFLVNRMDYALAQLVSMSVAVAIELVIGGLFAEVIAVLLPNAWGGATPLAVSPSERSLQARFLYGIAPLAFGLLLVLLAANWIVAGSTARRLLTSQMGNASQIAAEGVPVFKETGQELLAEIVKDPALQGKQPDELNAFLEKKFYNVPFFNQFYLVDRGGNTLAGFPQETYLPGQAPVEEQAGIQLALNGIPIQDYVSQPTDGDRATNISFIGGIYNQAGVPDRILIGRTNLAANPFARSILNSLNNFTINTGQGYLLDETGRILYSSDGTVQVLSQFPGELPESPGIYDLTGPDGTRQLAYYQPAEGHSWSVLIMVPARHTQEIALRIATPLLWVILILSVTAFLFMRIQVKSITSSLQNLTVEAGKLAQGELDNPLPVQGEDETGQLRQAFEKMRASLKTRMDELKLLLNVSQGVASSLEFDDAVKPVLESAVATGASSARVVLDESVVPGLDGKDHGLISYSAGPAGDNYHYLDDQIFNLARNQDQIVMANVTRPRLFSFTPGVKRPESMIAIALRHESMFYGAFWVAFDQPHPFSQEETRFLTTLAGQAALAAANARLFQTAEVGRQRLAAILASTPDPVLVTDQHDRLILANPAAWQVLGLGMDIEEENPVAQIIEQKELLELLQRDSTDIQSIEITLPSGDTYLATASSVIADGQKVGRICLLRDITHFKELDTMKSEFVSTVSHDLRSPLTLMRGYATMLEMVGELNEQQMGYVRKIVGSVEDMSRLVNSLLDLGRIESGVDLQLELVPVQDIVGRVAGQLQMEATQKHIELVTEIAPQTPPLVEADPALLRQGLQNLIDNAIKYTRANGKVTVRVYVRQERMVFEVQDTGIGISPMDQPHLFEKFYRSTQPSSKDQRGAGLGLAIVKSIADRHGGKVWVESQLGKGSTFFFVIPLRQRPQEL